MGCSASDKWEERRGNGMLIASLLFRPQWTTHILPGHVNLGNEPLLYWYFHIFLYPSMPGSILHSYHWYNHKKVIILHCFLRPLHPLCLHTNTVNLRGKTMWIQPLICLIGRSNGASGIHEFLEQENESCITDTRVITGSNKKNYNKIIIFISKTCYLIFSSWYRELTAGPPNPVLLYPPLRSDD